MWKFETKEEETRILGLCGKCLDDMTGWDWHFVITKLSNEDELDKSIKRQLFFDEKKFNAIASVMTGWDWHFVIADLSNEDELDKSIKKELFFNDEKFKALSKSMIVRTNDAEGDDEITGYWHCNIGQLSKGDEYDKFIRRCLFYNMEMFMIMSSHMTGWDWWCIIYKLSSHNSFDRYIKTELFFNNKKFAVMASVMTGREWELIIGNLHNGDELDASIKKELFFNAEKFSTMASVITGEDWVTIIRKLYNKDELDASIKKELFFNDEKFSAMASVMTCDDWRNVLSNLAPGYYELDKAIKDKICSMGLETANKVKPVEEVKVEQPLEVNEELVKAYLDEIYYNDNDVSLNSKKLYMIQKLTELCKDRDYAIRFVLKNYNFDLRKVDIKKEGRKL